MTFPDPCSNPVPPPVTMATIENPPTSLDAKRAGQRGIGGIRQEFREIFQGGRRRALTKPGLLPSSADGNAPSWQCRFAAEPKRDGPIDPGVHSTAYDGRGEAQWALTLRPCYAVPACIECGQSGVGTRREAATSSPSRCAWGRGATGEGCVLPSSYQLRMTLPALPARIASKPCWKSLASRRWVMSGDRSSPPRIRPNIFCHVPNISRP